MRRRRMLAAGIAVVVAAAVFAAVGFGRGTSAVPVLGGGAAVAPANTAAFVALDTNMNSTQWKTLDGLLAHFPGYSTLLGKLQQGLEQKSGLSWTNDVKPELGPEVDVAVLPTASGGKPDAVLLTQPSDPATFASLLQKLSASGGGPAPVSAQVGGWTVVGDSRAAVDAVTGAASHLAGDPAYQHAAGRLEQNALVDAYANGAQARQLLSALGHTDAGSGKLIWAAGDVLAVSGGLKLDGFLHRDGTASQAYSSSLLDRIPADALAVVDFQADPGAAGAQVPASPIGAALAKVAGTLGGETALYVGAGSALPAVTLVTHPADPQAVLQALNDALSAAGNAAGGSASGGFSLGSILGKLQLFHAQIGDALVVSTSQQGVDAFTAGGPKLSGDQTFQNAQRAAGMPGQTTGFAYADLNDALPLAQGLTSLTGTTGSSAVPDLSALHTLTAFGSGESDGVQRFTAFLQVG